MKITFNEDMGVFRPGWTSNNLRAFENARYCGDKDGHFARTCGMPGRLLRREAQKRGVEPSRDLRG